jgi:hypothetical protein
MSNSLETKPDFRSYTIFMDCIGRSKKPGAPQRADKVLRYMEELHRKGILSEGPTHRTYLTLRNAWKVSSERNKDEAIKTIEREFMARFPKEARRMKIGVDS